VTTKLDGRELLIGQEPYAPTLSEEGPAGPSRAAAKDWKSVGRSWYAVTRRSSPLNASLRANSQPPAKKAKATRKK
jgi:hypothetical protein